MYNKEIMLKRIYEKYSNFTEDDEFFNTKIGIKTHKEKYLKKFYNIAAILIIGALMGTAGFATYQAIARKPKNYEKYDQKIKFNEKYDKYSKIIEKEVARSASGTTLELVSTNYDGGYVVLELKVTFSETDKELFELDKYTFDFALNNSPVIVDGEVQELVYGINKHDVEKISDLEYRGYYYVFIPDEYKNNKENFKLSFNNMKLVREVNTENVEYDENTTIIDDWDNPVIIYLDGEFDCEFSDKDINLKYLNDSKISDNHLTYDILTQKMEYVKITPMQTIIKIKSNLNDMKKNTLGAIDNSKEFIGYLDFKILDDNDEEIHGMIIKPSRVLTFPDGHKEYWDRYQMGSAVGANLEEVAYLVISNDDYNNKLTIIPTKQKFTAGLVSEPIGETYTVEVEK